MNRGVHFTLEYLYRPASTRFVEALKNPENTQKKILSDTLRVAQSTGFWQADKLASISSYEDFRRSIPLTEYSFYQPNIAVQMARANSIWQRWEPTSGSSQVRKWVPYNDAFLKQLHNASYPWLSDLYRRFPGIKRGAHYWSLSWLPEDLRGKTGTDDSELFPLWQRFFLKHVFPVPSALTRSTSEKNFWLATLLILASRRDLSMISVWSPTFLLRIVEDLHLHWGEIETALAKGRWPKSMAEISFKAPKRKALPNPDDPDFLRRLWPDLSLISCWDSSSSARFATEVRKIFHGVSVQGKGLWATEGVVTIPYENQFPLAIGSHFLEFKCLESGKVFPAWELQTGMRVQPLITSSNGFLRYALDDMLKVDCFLGRTPSLTFLGRLNGIDLVGEKMDYGLALGVLNDLSRQFSGQFYCLRAHTGSKPHYELLCSVSSSSLEAVENALESRLLRIHHYRLAREIGQLAPATVTNSTAPQQVLRVLGKSSISGQNKMEPLILADQAIEANPF